MKSETKFRVNEVDPFLKTLRFTWSESIQQVSINGTCDKFLSCQGKAVLLELKDDKGELSRLQAFKLWDARKKGTLAYVARPNNWKHIKEILRLLNKGEQLHGTDQTYSDNEIRQHLKF